MEKIGDDLNPIELDLLREKRERNKIIQDYYGNSEDFFCGGDNYGKE